MKERIPTKHWRLQAQILHINSYKIIWFNCYSPTDPQTLQFDDQELSIVLDEIENILDNNVFDDCILGGDFNYDTKRTSGFATCMKNFLSRLGLLSVWEKFPIDFTHIHTDLKSCAVLDHFFVNQRLLDNVEDAGPVHLGDNLSRHSPIMMKIKLDQAAKIKVQQPEIPRLRRPAWYKATEEQKDQYTDHLDIRLKELAIPDSLNCTDVTCQCQEHSEQRDGHVIEILCSLVETSYTCIPLTARAKQGNHQHLPGWKENFAPLKKDSLFWHSVWLSAG